VTPAAPLVFVVDDDPSVRKALSRLLRSLGFDAEAFPTAEELLACDHLGAGACVLLDVQMKGMGGTDLPQGWSSLGCRIPIVLISGQEDAGAWMAADTAGIFGCLRKPFTDRALLAAVHKALSGGCSAIGEPDESAP
jgi:FixJ family two-component response regulator